MPVAENYRRQVALLMKVMPFVAAEKCFALRGGTAIISLSVTCLGFRSILI